MKTTSFLRSALLFTAATAGAEATPGEASAAAGAPETPATPETATKKAKKQHTVTLFEKDKDFLFDLMGEFYGPQASNPDEKRFLSTAEGFHVLLEVATDHRTGHRAKRDENGQIIYTEDENPVPVMETYDRFAEAAAKVIEARGIVRRENQVSTLQAKIAELQAELEKQKAAKSAEVPATTEG